MGKKQPKGNRGSRVLSATTTTTTGSSVGAIKTNSLTDSLPLDEKEHLERCTLDFQTVVRHSDNSRSTTSSSNSNRVSYNDFVTKAVQILEKEHVLIIHNCLSEDQVQTLHDCYERHHAHQSGQRAIGEKDASKRSGTRLYNCLCQLGPACEFYDWKQDTIRAQQVLNPRLIERRQARGHFEATTTTMSIENEREFCYSDTSMSYIHKQPRQSRPQHPAVWQSIAHAFHFHHVARVEVVTSHVGCRAQAWHIDGVHGLTVIFPLQTVGLRQGPTELDFSVPFVGLRQGDSKVKTFSSSSTLRAVMPQGSVLLFNANVSHRGSANIGNTDRPILVVDCSLESTCLAAGGPRDIWTVGR